MYQNRKKGRLPGLDALNQMQLELSSLVIFRNLKDDAVIAHLGALLGAADASPAEQVLRYADFVAALYAHGTSLTQYVLARVLTDDNLYVRRRAPGACADALLEECVGNELKLLERISRLSARQVRAAVSYDGYLPGWETDDTDFAAAYARRMEDLATCGYGIFAEHHMFVLKDGAPAPVPWPDPVRLDDLKGYVRQKQAVVDNTLALLAGRPAANVLLYGDAGTGKSSTVKAVANAYRDRGLRLIEVTKKQFRDIPALVQTLRDNPLKFILFIDDLSFMEQSDDFNALKAVLEGSAFGRPGNIAIYVTSNRRHMVRELFSDRAGDEVHRNETQQELASLSGRFGLSVGFFKPGKAQYLEIVRALKEQFGIRMDDAQLELEAERFASAGRSGRTARQFIESVLRSKPE